MVEGPHGVGLAYLPRHPRELLPRLPHFAGQSLRSLAALSRSWDPLEMALGIAAIRYTILRGWCGSTCVPDPAI